MPTQTCATVIYTDPSEHFDPFRDSHATDVFLYHDSSDADRKLDVLLCGFNDLRSVALTIGEAERKGSLAAMSFTLNDLRAEPIARSLLILHALMISELDRETMDRFIGQLRFSEHLESAALAYWVEQMRACLDVNWHTAYPRSKKDRTKTARETLILRSRVPLFLELGPMHTLGGRTDGRLACGVERFVDDGAYFLGDYRGQLHAQAQPNSESPPRYVVNPTFRASSTKISSPLGTPLAGIFMDASHQSIDQGLWSQLTKWIGALVSAFGPDAPSAPSRELFFVLGDAVLVLEEMTSDPELRFDVVETSTLADRCGFSNLLLHGLAVLKYSDGETGDHSLLCICSSHKSNHDSIAHALLKEEHGSTRGAREALESAAFTAYCVLPVLFGVAFCGSGDYYFDHWHARTHPFAPSEPDERRVSQQLKHRQFFLRKLAPPDVPLSIADSKQMVVEFVRLSFLLSKVDPCHSCALGGPHFTGALLMKAFAYAFAAGRIVWSHGALYNSLPWQRPDVDMNEISGMLIKSGTPFGSCAESILVAHYHGFPRGVPGQTDPFVYRAEATFTLLSPSPLSASTAAIFVNMVGSKATTVFRSIRAVHDAVRGTVQVTWYLSAEHVADRTAKFSLGALRAHTRLDDVVVGNPKFISDELGFDQAGRTRRSSPASTPAVKTTRVRVTELQSAIHGITASASAASTAPASPPAWHLSAAHFSLLDHANGRLVLHLPAGRERVRVKPVPASDLAQHRGAVALLVDDKVQTFRLPYTARATDVKVDRKSRTIVVSLALVAQAVDPALGLPALIPRIALPPIDHGQPDSLQFRPAGLIVVNGMYSKAESPHGLGQLFFPRLMSDLRNLGACSSVALKAMHLEIRAKAEDLPCLFVGKVLDRGGSGNVVVVFFVNRPVHLPPQGKAFGLTTALDVSYLCVPDVAVTKRAVVNRIRPLIEAAEDAHFAQQSQRFHLARWSGEHSAAIREYFDFGHAAVVDRGVPDVTEFPKTDAGTAAAFAVLKSELKRGLAFPLYPTV
ncbi:hypothetical protein H9P43_009158 [Blastocladiella emersonii ATCC 22665]|nr:hypothetical protein H9P43_009158 [Blastocladiella emersonii ATCC 22665]